MIDPTKAWVASELTTIKELFGAPPLLSSEGEEGYDAILRGFVECIRPQNFLDRLRVRHLADEAIKIERYKRHQVLAVSRRESLQEKLEQDRRKSEAARQAAKVALNSRLAEPASDRTEQNEIVIQALTATNEEMKNFQAHNEVKDARALEASIGYFEKLDALMNASKARLNGDLLQIEWHRQSLTLNSSNASVIEGDCKEIGADGEQRLLPAEQKIEDTSEVSIVPKEQPDEQPTQNSGEPT